MLGASRRNRAGFSPQPMARRFFMTLWKAATATQKASGVRLCAYHTLPFAAAALGRRFPVEPRKQFRTPLLSIARLKAVDELRCIVRKRCPSHLRRI